MYQIIRKNNFLQICLLLCIIVPLNCEEKISIYAFSKSYDDLGYWKDQEWIDIEVPARSTKSELNTFNIYEEKVYIAGCSEINDQWIPGYWVNGKWNKLPLPDGYGVTSVKAVEIVDNDIYLIGVLYDEQWKNISGYWKNNEWSTLAGKPNVSVELESFDYYNGKMYWSGVDFSRVPFRRSGFHPSQTPGYFINKEYITLPLSDRYVEGEVKSIKIIENDVYAMGYCKDKEDTTWPGYWKNRIWIEIPSPNQDFPKFVTDIAVKDNDTYTVCNDGGYWYNSSWKEISDGSDQLFFRTIHLYKDGIILSGMKLKDKMHIPGYWINNTWIEFAEQNVGQRIDDIIIVSE